MKKSELDWLLKRYIDVFKDRNPDKEESSIYIVGSQSFWGKHNSGSEIMKFSRELDVIPDVYSEEIDCDYEFVLGENSIHHMDFNTALDIVEEKTIKVPTNWKDRCINKPIIYDGFKLSVKYLDPHDLLFAKIIANREKDLRFIEEMFRCNILSVKKLNNIFNNEMNEHLKSEKDYLRIRDKLNYFINKHLNPSKKIKIYKTFEIDDFEDLDNKLKSYQKKKSSLKPKS